MEEMIADSRQSGFGSYSSAGTHHKYLSNAISMYDNTHACGMFYFQVNFF